MYSMTWLQFASIFTFKTSMIAWDLGAKNKISIWLITMAIMNKVLPQPVFPAVTCLTDSWNYNAFDVMTWRHFPYHWALVRGIHRDFPPKVMVIQSFGVFFVVRLNKLLNAQLTIRWYPAKRALPAMLGMAGRALLAGYLGFKTPWQPCDPIAMLHSKNMITDQMTPIMIIRVIFPQFSC